jgi:hypothetical protein
MAYFYCHVPSSSSSVSALMRWWQQGGPRHPKHSTSWSHPIAALLAHYTLVTLVSLFAHDCILAVSQTLVTTSTATTSAAAVGCDPQIVELLQPRRRNTALFCLSYFVLVLIWRLWFRKTVPATGSNSSNSSNQSEKHCRNAGSISDSTGGSNLKTSTASTVSACIPVSRAVEQRAVLYEYCWLCNVTLWMASIALLTHRPLLAQAYAVTVGIDQVLWYVDAISYVGMGKCIVGVASYLCWPGNTDWTSRITCTHHFWTIPVLLYGSGCIGGQAVGVGGLHTIAWPLSMVAMTINVVLSRLLTPSHVEECIVSTVFATNDTDTAATAGKTVTVTAQKYLNVNLSHALWKDIKFAILQINHDHPPARVYLVRLLWRWQGFNTLIFGLLFLLCELPRSHGSARMVC